MCVRQLRGWERGEVSIRSPLLLGGQATSTQVRVIHLHVAGTLSGND